MEQFLRVGVISSTHGIAGEVKVFPTTDDKNRFKKLKDCFISTKGGLMPVKIEKVRFFKQMVILKFEGMNDINTIIPYKNCDIMVSRENAVPLEEGEFFICDVIGAKVYTESGEEFGELKDVLQTGANDVFVISYDGGKEALFPVIPECVLDIDVENKKVVVHIMPGLL